MAGKPKFPTFLIVFFHESVHFVGTQVTISSRDCTPVTFMKIAFKNFYYYYSLLVISYEMKASDCVIQIDAINDIPTCRICLDDTGTSELISPCNCRGTMEFVHRECLDKWYDVSGETVS